MNTLHSYSYNEDIFLKMNVEPGVTNHGLVLFVDWSGSMVDNFHNTIKQTLNLVWFVRELIFLLKFDLQIKWLWKKKR